MNKILFFTLLLAFPLGIKAQIIGNQAATSNWRVGGGLGLSFGSNDYMSFNISPSLGYSLNTYTEVGVIAGYQYSKNRYYNSNLFNIGPYINVYPIQELFLRANYMYYSGNENTKKNVTPSYSYTVDENALWLGAGYQSTGTVRFQVGVLYNVLYKANESIFSNGWQPFAGINFNL